LPHHKSAMKRIRQDKKRRARNRRVKSEVKGTVKSVRQAGTAEDAVAKLAVAVSTIDKAAKKGIIHRRTAARKKSRLAKRANALKA
jgi:small subunit ribosomal protein S20